MDWSQFKDPMSHMYLASAVVADLNPFTGMTNTFVTKFREKTINTDTAELPLKEV